MQASSILVPTVLVIALGACGDKDEDAGPGGTGGDGADGSDGAAEEDTADGSDGSDDTDDTAPVDADGDGFSIEAGDCDDADPSLHPDQAETCDGIDNDCDGAVDAEDEDVTDAGTFYVDADGDSFGDPASGLRSCDGTGLVTDDQDCDDTRADVAPGLGETCGDGVVNDCDWTVADALAFCGQPDLTMADAELRGVSFLDQAGYCVRNAGDVDGDGATDFLVGAPHLTTSSGAGTPGRAYLVLGGSSGVLSLSTAIAELEGEQISDWAGQSVAGLGDLDGDGYGELLVGAWGYNHGTDFDAGAAYLVYGMVTGNFDLALADAILVGPSFGAYAGHAVAGGVDVTGDDVPDLLVGAYRANSTAGAAYLYASAPSGTARVTGADVIFTGSTAEGYAGAEVGFATDTNGDGIDEVLIGAYTDSTVALYAGAAHIVHGGALGSIALSAADSTLLGEAAGDYAGVRLDGAGDFDGDGLGDILVGATGESTGGIFAGAAYVFLGGTTGTASLSTAYLKLTAATHYDSVGVSVAGLGDIDGDGIDDVGIGASGQDGGGLDAGAVYLVSGGTSGTLSLGTTGRRIDGLAPNDYTGVSLDGLGDIDGDGLSDLLIGAHGRSASIGMGGAAYILRMSGY